MERYLALQEKLKDQNYDWLLNPFLEEKVESERESKELVQETMGKYGHVKASSGGRQTFMYDKVRCRPRQEAFRHMTPIRTRLHCTV